MPRLPNFRVLRRRRRMLELRQDAVARALGVSSRMLSMYERGYEPHTAPAKLRWSALAVAYARLLDEYEQKSRVGRSRSIQDEEEEI